MSEGAPPPSSEEQVRFLSRLQRLLEETRTTSTYKFALLLALADLSVEHGDGTGAPLLLSTDQIAAKFITYYWPHALPYNAACGPIILRQNTDRPARVLKDLREARGEHLQSLASVLSNRRIVSRVEQTVRTMPLSRLQRVGRGHPDFLYESEGACRAVALRPGVAYCFRKFHGLIQDLVRGAWLRFVRELNAKDLGAGTDLGQFLFGEQRTSLLAARRALEEVDARRCFFCSRDVPPARLQVDHFVPWSRYPADLGHNLVLSDCSCNSAKGSILPAVTHLKRWVERNNTAGVHLERAFASHGVLHDLAATTHIVSWAYEQTEASEGLTWEAGDRMAPLEPGWKDILGTLMSLS